MATQTMPSMARLATLIVGLLTTSPTLSAPISTATAGLKLFKPLEQVPDPAKRWFETAFEPCAPGWDGTYCNNKLLPLGEVPLPLPVRPPAAPPHVAAHPDRGRNCRQRCVW
eukprot:SAG22_NODE_2810_length_2190_cov_1.417025_1_plen_112_part_00